MLDSLPILPSFLRLVSSLRPCFPRTASYENFVATLFGWILAAGRGCLSDVQVAGGLFTAKHWTAFYRFFNRTPWSIDDLGLAVARMIVARLVPGGVIELAVDDTLLCKGGKNIFGAAMHHDAQSSTRTKARFHYGHCWVVLCVVVRFPFSSRAWSLPVLFRLFLTEKSAKGHDVVHKKKTVLAVEILELFAKAFPGREIRLVGDNLYSCKTIVRALPRNVHNIGKLDLDAALHAPLRPGDQKPMGCPRKWGLRIDNPEQVANDDSKPWLEFVASIYGRLVTIRCKTWQCYWRSAGHNRLLRCVVVWRPDGQWDYEAFYSTDPDLSALQIIEAYARRWSIEVTFHEVRASLGVDQLQQWSNKAVQRAAPTGMLLYSLITLWYVDHGHGTAAAVWRVRPWYTHKASTTFADMITTLRRQTLMPRLFAKVADPRPRRKVDHARERWEAQSAA